MQNERICFVISPIGELETDTRKRSDQILKHVIGPAANECGYISIRADQISEPGIITSQVIQHIVDDPLVIADLTGRNPNVFYELAVRHAIKRPLVQIIKKGEAIPFDVAGTRTIQVDHHDLDSVEAAKNEIIKQIRSVEKDVSEMDTPISVALDLQTLRQSENPEQRSLADIASAVSELRSSLSNIDQKISDSKKLLSQEHLIDFSSQLIRNLTREFLYFEEIRILSEKLSEITSSKRFSEEDKAEIRELCDNLCVLIKRLPRGCEF